MNFEVKIMLFFIGIILSIYIAVFTYFDIYRYCQIYRVKSLEKYIESYTNLPLYQPNKNTNIQVVININNESEFETQKPMFASLLDQTIKCPIVVTSTKSKEALNIPSEYLKFLNIIDSVNDYKKLTSLITILKSKNFDRNTIIIIINNKNLIFGKDLLFQIIQYNTTNSNSLLQVNSSNYLDSDLVLVKADFFKNVDYTIDKKEDVWLSENVVVKTKQIKYFENYKFK
jgi:hypothetical protein